MTSSCDPARRRSSLGSKLAAVIALISFSRKKDYEKYENNEINEIFQIFRLFRYFRIFRNLSSFYPLSGKSSPPRFAPADSEFRIFTAEDAAQRVEEENRSEKIGEESEDDNRGDCLSAG